MDSAEQSLKLEARLKLRFPLLSDPKMKVITAYGVADASKEISVPAVFVVDGARRIHYRHIGESITDRPVVEAVLSGVRQR